MKQMLWLACLTIQAGSMLAGSTLAAERELPRIVLALYDSRETAIPRMTYIHRMAEMPLNHLGVRVRYWDIKNGMPGAEQTKGVRGILTWWSSDQRDRPVEYLGWLEREMGRGMRVVVIGDLGASRDLAGQPTPDEHLTRFWLALGLHWYGGWARDTYDVRIAYKNPAMVEFERPYSGVLAPFERFTLANPQGTEHLRLRRGNTAGADSVVVATTPHGGFAALGYSHYADAGSNVQWYINPFEFFRLAFVTDDLPKPDTTTLCGRRLFYSHVDGDGWRNRSEIPRYRREGLLAAEAIYREIVLGYPNLPVTIAPIAADLDPDWYGSQQSLELARTMFRAPNVEVGSHTYTHPLEWDFFEHYDVAKERQYRQLGKRYDQPRSYMKGDFRIEQEIQGSIRFLEALAPPEKKVRIVQWSGNTQPYSAILAATRAAGVRNLNGGDTRLDPEFPSYVWVSPIGRDVNGQIQIYSSNSNENTYTDQWTDRFFAFQNLVKTVENTEHPIRVKPFNVYYHFFSGEKMASINALRGILDYAGKQELIPVAASAYAGIADGFFTVQLIELGPRIWRVENRDELDTIRFDRANGRAVDFGASRGVIGQQWHQGSLYVALDRAVASPVVALQARSGVKARHPYLIDSRWRIRRVAFSGSGVSFEAQGLGAGEMTWWVCAPGQYDARDEGGKVLAHGVAAADGTLRLELPGREGRPAQVTISRTLAASGR